MALCQTALYFLPLLFVISKADLNRDHQGLLALKRSLVDPKGHLENWKGGASKICLWKGVICDSSNLSVVELDLSSSDLEGFLAPEVATLTSLASLSLRNNCIAGEIPGDMFGKLDRLQSISLSVNCFTGSIPSVFSESSVLRRLDLYVNFLSGEIPSEICLLRNLQFLVLSWNKIKGNIPECLGDLSELQEIYLEGNNLSGLLPTTFQSLTKLQLLDVAKNHLVGPIPPELGKLSSLTSLLIHGNNLTGAIPPQLGNLSHLTCFDAASNRLEGSIPEELEGLKNLSLFHVGGNILRGGFPQWMAEHDQLSDITLYDNVFTGDVPQNFGRRKALRTVDLSDNLFTGRIPSALCQDGKLEYLAAMNNQFSGNLPAALQNCRTLTRLRLDNNRLTGSLHLSQQSAGLVTLSNNLFNGSFSMHNMSKLTELDVSSNQLTGELPTVLGTSKGLLKIALANNRFSGVLPSQLGQLGMLEALDLSRNSFSGDIPASLSSCDRLITLNLSRNSFNGVISLGRMSKLSVLDLSHNQLHGSIPLDLGQSSALHRLDLSYNSLSGEVPKFVKLIDTVLDGNAMLRWPGPRKTSPKTNARFRKYYIAVIAAALSALASLLLLCVYWVCRLPPKGKAMKFEPEWRIASYTVKHVSLADVLNCIGEDNVIFEGKRTVYKGELRDGTRIAVKKLQNIDNSQFQAEVTTLGKLRHRNIVKLLASCTNGTTHLLVYEFMPMGNLRELLHGKIAEHVSITWNKRIGIISGIAEGLAYLHHDYGTKVVHRDIKCENILLDTALEPRLGDFGLAKLLRKADDASTASKIAGTYGYIAPEYTYTLKVDEKADVYSFGVVMLELLTGKRATWRDSVRNLDLIDWAKLKPVEELALELGTEKSTCESVLEVALCCVESPPCRRPTMQMVVERLKAVRTINEQKKSYLKEALLEA